MKETVPSQVTQGWLRDSQIHRIYRIVGNCVKIRKSDISKECSKKCSWNTRLGTENKTKAK